MSEAGPRLLIVEDDAHTRQLLIDMCTASTHEVQAVAVADGESGLQEALTGTYDLMLLDLMLPHRDGFSVLTELRAAPQCQHLPVIILTAMGDLDGKLKSMELGATDWVSKPFKLGELQARVRAAMKISRDLQRLSVAEEELARLRAEDPVTGVGTWSQLKGALDGEIARARRHGRHASVLLLSLEGLGDANYHAPARAEAFVRTLLERTQGRLRGGDRLYRMETDAFVAVLPESDLQGAQRAARRMSELAEELREDGHGAPLDIRVVIAGAAYPHPRAQTAEELLREAARAYAHLRSTEPDALYFTLPASS